MTPSIGELELSKRFKKSGSGRQKQEAADKAWRRERKAYIKPNLWKGASGTGSETATPGAMIRGMAKKIGRG